MLVLKEMTVHCQKDPKMKTTFHSTKFEPCEIKNKIEKSKLFLGLYIRGTLWSQFVFSDGKITWSPFFMQFPSIFKNFLLFSFKYELNPD
jgi:hypothetical protein